VRVFSRNAKDWTEKVPAIVEGMRMLPVRRGRVTGFGRPRSAIG
jgi:hypothetical protein